MSVKTSTLPNELWIKSLSYLDICDLTHSIALVNRALLDLSSDDSIWYEMCERKWEGKLNVSRFFVRDGVNDSDPRDLHADHSFPFRTAMTFCSQLVAQFGHPRSVPPLNMCSLMHQPTSWKESYWMAELDSHRETITREELTIFRFQLVYMGSPSKMGLRQFNRDGFYESPYMGRTEWILHGQQLLFAGMSLLIERDKGNWGWIIGRGERTEYISIEEIAH